MEQRSHYRTPVHTRVDVQFPGHAYLATTTRDMSFKGMFVEIDQAPVPRHGIVRIRIWGRNGFPARCCQMAAVVARRSAQGIALVYGPFPEQMLGWIRQLIHGARQEAGTAWPDSARVAGSDSGI